MAQQQMIKDLSFFLTPIRSDAPCGDHIRYDPIYRKMHDLRTRGAGGEKADYRTLEQLCETTLQHTSKDLHVAAITAETWFFLYGLGGLADGLDLITVLCKEYWDTLYPQNPNDPEIRLNAFVWINDKLSDVLLTTLITQPTVPGVTSFNLANLIDAQELGLTLQKAGLRRSDILEQAVRENRPTLDAISKSMAVTSNQFYEGLLNDIQLVRIATEKLEEMLDDCFHMQAISLKNVHGYLSQLETYAKGSLDLKKTAPQADVVIAIEANDPPAEQLPPSVQTLDSLYQQLHDIADQLEDLDSNSIAPQLIRKAAEWGRMNTADLLNELARQNIGLSEITKIINR